MSARAKLPPLVWIPATEGAEFPYGDARRWLECLEDVRWSAKDFRPLISAGRRIGWSDQVVAEHEAMADRGQCKDFEQSTTPRLRGTLFETSVFFQFEDEAHMANCVPYIERGSRQLGVRILERSR